MCSRMILKCKRNFPSYSKVVEGKTIAKTNPRNVLCYPKYYFSCSILTHNLIAAGNFGNDISEGQFVVVEVQNSDGFQCRNWAQVVFRQIQLKNFQNKSLIYNYTFTKIKWIHSSFSGHTKNSLGHGRWPREIGQTWLLGRVCTNDMFKTFVLFISHFSKTT